jgi:NAD(P)-dependent dehydrogenase (short-subunit alcohol dehydrogenase family)
MAERWLPPTMHQRVGVRRHGRGCPSRCGRLNVFSISALHPQATDSISKDEVSALTKVIAVDHGPDGIRANCLATGPVYIPTVCARGMTKQAHDTPPSLARKRAGTSRDIGSAMGFLLSEPPAASSARFSWTVTPPWSGPAAHPSSYFTDFRFTDFRFRSGPSFPRDC